MNPWPFVTAAYALTVVVSAGLAVWGWLAMRSAEKRVP
jgi:hypothetical protein